MQPIVVLAALRPELAPLRRRITRPGVAFFRTGIGPRRAAEVARRRCNGARLVLSAGCCGGLAPGVRQGLVVIPDRVLDLQDDQVTDAPRPDPTLVAAGRRLARRHGLQCSSESLCTVSAALLTPESKRDCHVRTGAAAVDMETAAIARVAGELGVPYLSMRVVLDTCAETLPQIPASGGLRPVLEVARKPAALISLAALGLRLGPLADSLARCAASVLEELDPSQ